MMLLLPSVVLTAVRHTGLCALCGVWAVAWRTSTADTRLPPAESSGATIDNSVVAVVVELVDILVLVVTISGTTSLPTE